MANNEHPTSPGSRLLDLGRTSLKFSKVETLIAAKEDPRILTIFSQVSCLTTIAELDTLEGISALVDFIADMQVPDRHLVLFTQSRRLDLKMIKNKSINFDVLLSVQDASGNKLIKMMSKF